MAAEKINPSAPHGAHLLDVMMWWSILLMMLCNHHELQTTKIVYSKDDIIRNEKLLPANYKPNN